MFGAGKRTGLCSGIGVLATIFRSLDGCGAKNGASEHRFSESRPAAV
jgi:hypothetical protein